MKTIRRLRPARLAHTWAGARSAVLTVSGFSALTAAAWTVATGLGLAAAGVSLLLLEYLSADGGTRR